MGSQRVGHNWVTNTFTLSLSLKTAQHSWEGGNGPESSTDLWLLISVCNLVPTNLKDSWATAQGALTASVISGGIPHLPAGCRWWEVFIPVMGWAVCRDRELHFWSALDKSSPFSMVREANISLSITVRADGSRRYNPPFRWEDRAQCSFEQFRVTEGSQWGENPSLQNPDPSDHLPCSLGTERPCLWALCSTPFLSVSPPDQQAVSTMGRSRPVCSHWSLDQRWTGGMGLYLCPSPHSRPWLAHCFFTPALMYVPPFFFFFFFFKVSLQ